jgi:hypothetical protein
MYMTVLLNHYFRKLWQAATHTPGSILNSEASDLYCYNQSKEALSVDSSDSRLKRH